tara:strand:+ start:321 stop:485 length:165 start_codon:yes stop_codon:yes gene_type:complete
MNRYKELNPLSLSEIEQELDTLMATAGDDPSDETIQEVTLLMGAARALGSVRSW